MITGGGDVQPSRYGAKPIPETQNVDPARDDFDLRLFELALERDVPVLATCRGMQIVNVALGGSLVQHVPAVTGQVHNWLDRGTEPVHKVKIEPESRLAEALGETELEVNSLHHQAVCDAAPGHPPGGVGRGRHGRGHRAGGHRRGWWPCSGTPSCWRTGPSSRACSGSWSTKSRRA